MTVANPPSADLPTRTIQIALAGNPNVGKTTLFNALTGARQRVGNYPGVTVEKKAGKMQLGDEMVSIIDLPGTYSLAAASADERVVIDVLTGHIEGTAQPDVVVCVVDATNLMRNLFLASQIADIGLPVVIAMNMVDAAEQQGSLAEAEALASRLDVPVVPIVAKRGKGISELKAAIEESIDSHRAIAPMPWPESVERALTLIGDAAERDLNRTVGRVERLRMLFDIDSAIPARLGWPSTQVDPILDKARSILAENGLAPASAEAILRYGRLGEILDGVLSHPEDGRNDRKATRGESVDRLLTHRVWGLVIFLGLMTLVFQSIYVFAAPLMDSIDWLFGAVGDIVGPVLVGMPMLQSLVVDGVIAGVGSVIIFLPQILILFFFISLLEDTGYMSRAAFLMDKLFSWCGLNGKSFVPLLSCYACAVPGVMAARTIEDPKARLTTILIAPMMSCSARLPVYVLLIGAFIEPTYGPFLAGVTLVLMHIVGLAVAIPVAMVLNRFVVKGTRVPFVMEMPPYRTPQLRAVLIRMWHSAQKFLKRAGTVIFAMTIVIWALTFFPRHDAVATHATSEFVQEAAVERNLSIPYVEDALDRADDDDTVYNQELANQLERRIQAAYIEQSYLGRFGKTVQPIFALAGFDWKITVGVLASFPAREVIIATLGIIYDLGGDVDEESSSLIERLQNERWTEGPRMGERVFSPAVALAVMVFFALCLQCGSTVAVMAREASWGWAGFGFTYMTILAWIGAVVTYQLGTTIGL